MKYLLYADNKQTYINISLFHKVLNFPGGREFYLALEGHYSKEYNIFSVTQTTLDIHNNLQQVIKDQSGISYT